MPPAGPTINLPTPTLPDVDINQVDTALTQAITPGIVWLVFILVVLFVIIMTIVLRWHWKRYTLNSRTERKMTRLYTIGVSSGLIALAILIAIYTANYAL